MLKWLVKLLVIEKERREKAEAEAVETNMHEIIIMKEKIEEST